MPLAPPRATPTDELLSLADAATLIGVHPSTLRRWIADHRLPAYRFGPRALRVKRTELEALAVPTTGWE